MFLYLKDDERRGQHAQKLGGNYSETIYQPKAQLALPSFFLELEEMIHLLKCKKKQQKKAELLSPLVSYCSYTAPALLHKASLHRNRCKMTTDCK